MMDVFTLFEKKIAELNQMGFFIDPNAKEDTTKKHVVLGAELILEDMKVKSRSFSYDVGERVGGSKKELAALRKAYDLKPAIETLERINELDPILARKILNKKTLFAWATFENMQDLGITAPAAKGIKAVIRSLPADSSETSVLSYFKAIGFVSNVLKDVKTLDELKVTIKRLVFMVDSVLKEANYIRMLEDKYRREKERYHYVDIGSVKTFTVSSDFQMGQLVALHKRFNQFKKHYTFFNDLEGGKWDELLEKKTVKKGVSTLWRRELPEKPKRVSDNQLVIAEKPEEIQKLFNLKSIEFGNYVNDIDAEIHLKNASSALQDLAYVLDVPLSALSEFGTLSFGFGSRGSGRALAHYERGYHIINLTKKKGGLGVLAHEWLHSFDNFLGAILLEGNIAPYPMLTENIYKITNPQIKEALIKLFSAIKDGRAIDYINLSNIDKYTYKPSSTKLKLYNQFINNDENSKYKNNLNYMDHYLDAFDEKTVTLTHSYKTEESKVDFQRRRLAKRMRLAKTVATDLAVVHFNQTGEMLTLIPYHTTYTRVYNNSIKNDRGNVGKYWSSDVELFARTFESYVYSTLKELHWQNDYLVAGLDYVYPVEDELLNINTCMKQLLDLIVPYLIEE